MIFHKKPVLFLLMGCMFQWGSPMKRVRDYDAPDCQSPKKLQRCDGGHRYDVYSACNAYFSRGRTVNEETYSLEALDDLAEQTQDPVMKAFIERLATAKFLQMLSDEFKSLHVDN